jgi:Nucleoside 2-deoxyribosyltransferase
MANSDASLTESLEGEQKPETKFVALDGRWKFGGATAAYEGPAPYEGTGEQQRHDGVCLAATRFHAGVLTVQALIEDPSSAARFVFGFNAGTGTYYSVGINGWYRAYVLSQFTSASHQLLRAEGPSSILTAGQKLMSVTIQGQRVSLLIDSVCVLEHVLPFPIEGDQVGLYVWGSKAVSFENLIVHAARRKGFVVMQFGKEYDVFWKEVIVPVARKAGFEAVRADDIYGPGVILQDIIRQIVECDVIIAEITPTNANVFYELGYAHALGKPTILLANRALERLPFDISGYRVVYYSDTIGGKSDVESALCKHLNAVRLGQTSGY